MTTDKKRKAQAGDGKSSEAADDGNRPEKKQKKQRKAPESAQPWTKEEERVLIEAALKIALSNVTLLRQEPGLASRGSSKINVKLRGLAKDFDKQFGGDGKWVQSFRLVPTAGKKSAGEGDDDEDAAAAQ